MKLTDKTLRYAAVYGAFVAAQVRDRMRDGFGPPDYELMRNFVEEAHTVAQMSEECQEWEPAMEDEVRYETEV